MKLRVITNDQQFFIDWWATRKNQFNLKLQVPLNHLVYTQDKYGRNNGRKSTKKGSVEVWITPKDFEKILEKTENWFWDYQIEFWKEN